MLSTHRRILQQQIGRLRIQWAFVPIVWLDLLPVGLVVPEGLLWVLVPVLGEVDVVVLPLLLLLRLLLHLPLRLLRLVRGWVVEEGVLFFHFPLLLGREVDLRMYLGMVV